MKNRFDNITIQGIGQGINVINQMRADEYIKNIRVQDINFEKAIEELTKARDFIGAPEHILGSPSTKHGEVAEVFEVRFGNADKIIRGEQPNYSFEGVGRTAPEDYLKNNLPVQSKFVQTHLSMDAVMEHLNDYPDFVNSGGSYCIPKDYYAKITEWLKLSPDELKELPASEGGRIARSVVNQVRNLEEKTGKQFGELVEASQLEYDQVQLKRASGTIDGKEREIIKVDQQKRQTYWKDAQANIKEGFKAAGAAAAVSAVLSFSTTMIGKLCNGKKISEFTDDDWIDIFKETGMGTIKGGVSGGAIYALTNATKITAPVAAGIVTATIGIGMQAISLSKEEITPEEFFKNMVDISTSSAVSTVGAIVGTSVAGSIAAASIGGTAGSIAGPVGAVIGSAISTAIYSLVKQSYMNIIEEIKGEGAYGAIQRASECIYGMSSGLEEYYKKIEDNMNRTKINIYKAQNTQKLIDRNFDLFESLKGE